MEKALQRSNKVKLQKDDLLFVFEFKHRSHNKQTAKTANEKYDNINFVLRRKKEHGHFW